MRRPRAMGAQRVFSALLAVALGVLGWLVGHGLMSWLLEQHRLDVIDSGSQPHGPSYVGALGSVAGGMVLGSLLAMFLLGRQVRGGKDPRAPAHLTLRRSVRALSALSMVGFVLAELFERFAVGDHQVPPVTVVLVGVALQVLVASVTCVVWRSCVRSVLRLRSQPCPVTGPASVGRAAPVAVAGMQTWFSDRAGRAPPISDGIPRPTFV